MFVTLEGIDRSGKSTQAALLAESLGPDTILIREPGGTPMAEQVRGLLKDPSIEMGEMAELLLFCAARSDLVEKIIGPAVERGVDVVCDRFFDSTAAYQGAARGLGMDLVETLTGMVAASTPPDRTLLLRVDPDLAHARGQQRIVEGEADGEDRFESEGLEFQRAVASAYDEIAERNPERITVVDATGEPAEVHTRVMRALGR